MRSTATASSVAPGRRRRRRAPPRTLIEAVRAVSHEMQGVPHIYAIGIAGHYAGFYQVADWLNRFRSRLVTHGHAWAADVHILICGGRTTSGDPKHAGLAHADQLIEVSLSVSVIDPDRLDRRAGWRLRGTFAHEMAHSLAHRRHGADGMGHGEGFAEAADEIGRIMGIPDGRPAVGCPPDHYWLNPAEIWPASSVHILPQHSPTESA